MCCVALYCSDVKYVVIVLLFATIWTTDWTELNWTDWTDCRVCKNAGAWRSLRGEGSAADCVVICWDLNNWIGGFVRMLARAYSGVPFVGQIHKQSLLLFAAIWTINWAICPTAGNIKNRRFRCSREHKNSYLGGPRAMCCVALYCSDVKYVVIVLLFATIWTTELNWTDWTEL